ncbi:MAG: hypothetical protein LBR39_01860 [Coriobacteriales bacterium]|jgi:hypothetical protein|nr:hypothetical protein [Coriobacteriales bacterium]
MKRYFSAATAALVLSISLLMAAAALTGCTPTGVYGPTKLPAPEPTESTALTLGTAGGDTHPVLLTNRSGKQVSEVAFSYAGAEDFAALPAEAGFDWADGSQLTIYFKSDSDITALYDVRFSFTDGSSTVLHDIELMSIVDGNLRADASGAAYLDYYDVLGYKHSTIDSEAAWQAEQEAAARAAAEAEAEAQRQAEEAAAAEAAAAAAAQSSSGYNYAPSGGGGSVGQSGDSCLADLF